MQLYLKSTFEYEYFPFIIDSAKKKYYGAIGGPPINKNKLKSHTVINTKLYNRTKDINPTSFLSSSTVASVATKVTYPTAVSNIPVKNPFRAASSFVSIDNRPRQFLISEIENGIDEKASILKHFKTFGNVDITKDIDESSMVIEFTTRKEAEYVSLIENANPPN